MITTIKHITKELSEELDIPIDMVEENVKYLIQRLRNVMHQESVLEIRLSDRLGTMFCNRHTITHRRMSLRYELQKFSSRTDKFIKIHKRLDDKYNFIMANRHNKLYSSKTNSYQRHVVRVKGIYKEVNMTMQEAQDFQNKKYNESIKRIKGDRKRG